MSQLYTKQEISQLMNLSYKTLRIYEEKGLITPCYIDSHNGYKYYNEIQIYTIEMIRYSNCELDISLKEIKELLGESNHLENLVQVLQEKKTKAEDMIKKYQQIVENINICLTHNKYTAQLYQPYIAQLNHIYYSRKANHCTSYLSYWSIAQDIYEYLNVKRVNFVVQKQDLDPDSLYKIGIMSDTPLPFLAPKLEQEAVSGNYLCIPFSSNKENYKHAIETMESFSKENQLSLDHSSIFMVHHSFDFCSEKMEDTTSILKIRIDDK